MRGASKDRDYDESFVRLPPFPSPCFLPHMGFSPAGQNSHEVIIQNSHGRNLKPDLSLLPRDGAINAQ